jgi:hypothetical protein
MGTTKPDKNADAYNYFDFIGLFFNVNCIYSIVLSFLYHLIRNKIIHVMYKITIVHEK